MSSCVEHGSRFNSYTSYSTMEYLYYIKDKNYKTLTWIAETKSMAEYKLWMTVILE